MVIKNNFSLLRTNVKLTSNYKLLVGGDNIYLSSIKSNGSLSDVRYENVIYKNNTGFNNNIKDFWYNTDVSNVYSMLDNDNSISDYNSQYSTLYWSGASSFESKDIKYKHEYFAPVFMKQSFSEDDFFIIFRTLGIGLYDLKPDNFKSELLDNLTVVDVKNLKSILGDITSDIVDDNGFVDINLGVGEFSYVYGIDIISGVKSKKSLYLADSIKYIQKVSDVDILLTDSFEKNSIITNKILNVSYLFNDDVVDDFSINKYYGFYGKLQSIKKMTTRKVTHLKTYYSSNIKINIDSDNYFINIEDKKYINPFYKDVEAEMVIEYNGILYDVVKTDVGYKILCDYNLENKINLINKNIISVIGDYIMYDVNYYNTFNDGQYSETSVIVDGISHEVYTSSDLYDILTLIEDIYIIKLYGNYYRLVSDDNGHIKLSYVGVVIGSDIYDVEIYKFILYDIADFDNNVINTEYSNFEYDVNNLLINTSEPKLYREINNVTDSYIVDGNYTNIPTTSEYISTGELFEVIDDKLNRLWDVNRSICKFGFYNSIETNDYVHRINPVYDHLKVDIDSIVPDRRGKNLDFFYNINYDLSSKIDSQSLSIVKYNGVYDTTYNFNVQQFFTDSEYYNNFFNYIEYINGYNKKVEKYCVVNPMNDVNYTNTFLFKGLLCNIYSVVNNKLIPTNEFDSYDASFILSPLSHVYNGENFISVSTSNLVWGYVKKWEKNTKYNGGDVVSYRFDYTYDVVIGSVTRTIKTKLVDNYIVNNVEIVADVEPMYDVINYTLYTSSTFYTSNNNYLSGDIVYYDGEWWLATANIAKSVYSGGILLVNNFPTINSNWSQIELYDNTKTQEYYIKSNDVYNISGEIVKTITPNKQTMYKDSGTILLHNNSIMYLRYGSGYLNDGVNIYIDSVSKKIVVNLYSNDNTLTISNINRDDMYSICYSKFTAKSVIDYIQYNRHDSFINGLNIIYKDVDGVISNYDYDSSLYRFVFKPYDVIKGYVKNVLYDKIYNANVSNKQVIKYDSLSYDTLNYYDNREIGYTLNVNDSAHTIIDISIYSGEYYPIFKKIPICNDNRINTTISNFAQLDEVLINKYIENDTYNINNLSRIYPIIDYINIGYTNYMIFKSQFDLAFYKKYLNIK